MSRLVSFLVFLVSLWAFVACATSPVTPTVTIAIAPPSAISSPVPSATVIVPTATTTPLSPTSTRTPFPEPRIGIFAENGISAEYRYSALDIAISASGGAYAWAWQDYSSEQQTTVYPGLLFLPAWNLLGTRYLEANQPIVLAVESKQERVVTGSVDGELEIWNARTGMRDFVFGKVRGKPAGIALNADDSLIAVGANGRFEGGDGSVTIWEKDETKPLKVLPTYGAVTRVAFAPNSNTLYFSTNASSCSRGGGGVFMWNTEMAEAKRVFSASGNPVIDFAVDASGKYIASVGQNGTTRCTGLSAVSVWNVESGQVVLVLPQTERAQDGSTAAWDCASVAFSPDSKRLAVGDTVGNFSIWNWEQKKMEKAIEFSTSPISRVIWSMDNMLFLDDDDGYVRLFRAP